MPGSCYGIISKIAVENPFLNSSDMNFATASAPPTPTPPPPPAAAYVAGFHCMYVHVPI